MKNGSTVAAFEREFGAYVGAKYAIALCNGTATLHTALVALGVKRGDRVAVPPLTMASTTIAVLHAGAVPVFADVDERTWLMRSPPSDGIAIPVSLYGLHAPLYGGDTIDDAAQTLRPHRFAVFTSYSFQASKILALGEGGMLVTDSEELATKAREFSSLGYRMIADQPRIETETLKSPAFERHHSLGWNYRMNDVTAQLGLSGLKYADELRAERTAVAGLYRAVHVGCSWLTPQHVPEGWSHDYWCYPLALELERCDWHALTNLIERRGGERPYAAWRLTYQEPAFRHLAPDGTCPVAESLQPQLLQMQTNDLASAERNAQALRQAIQEVGG